LEDTKEKYQTSLRIWKRYIETLSFDSVLRNDKQKFYHVELSREVDGLITKDEFVARRRSQAKIEYNRLIKRQELYRKLLSNERGTIEDGEYNLIFTPMASAQFLIKILASSFILGDDGRGAMDKFFGKKVASDLITVVDDPTLEGGSGSFLVDESGNRGEKKKLLSDGVVTSFIANGVSSLNLGLTPGPCRSISFMMEARPSPSNIYVEPKGYMGFEDIKNQFESGIIVHYFNTAFVLDRFGPFVTALGLVEYFNRESGESFMVDGCRIRYSIPEFMNKICHLGSDLEFFSSCWYEPLKLTIPYSYGAPSMGIESVRIEKNG